jgi:hypothetical protein
MENLFAVFSEEAKEQTEQNQARPTALKESQPEATQIGMNNKGLLYSPFHNYAT